MRCHKWIVLTLAMLVLGCNTAKSEPVTASPSVAVDVWTRSVECSDRAARMMARPDWADAPGVTTRRMGWRAHYNRELQVCYILTTYLDQGPQPKDMRFPRVTHDLWDVLENKAVAAYTDESISEDLRGTFCHADSLAETAQGDCRLVKAEVESAMSK